MTNIREGAAARAAFILPAGACLLMGLAGALALLGLAPTWPGVLADRHGWLMTLGFMGTLIALERAVALRAAWGFLSPAGLGLGALGLVAGLPGAVWFLVGGALTLCLVYLPLWNRTRDDAVLVQALGAALLAGATLLAARGTGLPDAVVWIAGFVVATIAGERLELARIAMPAGAGGALVALTALLAAATGASLLWDAGYRAVGAAILALAAWLARHDVARRTVRATGQARFSAACMLAAFAWLAVAGAIWLGGPPRGAGYDAVIHAVFLGYAMSMILAHAPVILPAVLRRPLPYHRAMWAPAVALHAGLVVRLAGGDALGSTAAHTAGGVLNVAALLGFVVVAVVSSVAATRRTRRTTAPRKAADR